MVHGGLPCRHWGPGLPPASPAFLLTTSCCLWALARTPGLDTRENPEKLKTSLAWGVWSFSLQTSPGCLDRICLSESLLGPGGSPLPSLPSGPGLDATQAVSVAVSTLSATVWLKAGALPSGPQASRHQQQRCASGHMGTLRSPHADTAGSLLPGGVVSAARDLSRHT